MSGPRARANHKLYLARILLAAWREALARERVPSVTLNQAFAAPVREHLADAYGWFLLEICPPPELPAKPPRGCGELPEIAAGKALPGEIREFTQMEESGWLAQLLSPWDEWGSHRRQGIPGSPNLAFTATTLPGADELGQCAERLEALFDRMGESLDEY